MLRGQNNTRNFSLHENICGTHVSTLSAGELGTMSKNNLAGIAVRKGLSLTLHPLLREVIPCLSSNISNTLLPSVCECEVSTT